MAQSLLSLIDFNLKAIYSRSNNADAQPSLAKAQNANLKPQQIPDKDTDRTLFSPNDEKPWKWRKVDAVLTTDISELQQNTGKVRQTERQIYLFFFPFQTHTGTWAQKSTYVATCIWGNMSVLVGIQTWEKLKAEQVMVTNHDKLSGCKKGGTPTESVTETDRQSEKWRYEWRESIGKTIHTKVH